MGCFCKSSILQGDVYGVNLWELKALIMKWHDMRSATLVTAEINIVQWQFFLFLFCFVFFFKVSKAWSECFSWQSINFNEVNANLQVPWNIF